MALEAQVANILLSAGPAGVDKWGKIWVTIKRALEATGFWEQAGAGDGLAATTTGSTDIFTSNGGLGYKASGGTTWLAAQGTANSFSNALAWFRLREVSSPGVPTGREFAVHRSSSTASGNEGSFNVRATVTGFTGASSATSPPTGGTHSPLFGSGAFGTTGVNLTSASGMATALIATANTINFHILVPTASESKGVAPFHAFAHIGTDVGWSFFYDFVKECASADNHPCVWAMDSWAANYGEFFGSTFNISQGTSSSALSADATGALQTATIERWVDAQGRPQPGPGSSTAETADADGKYVIRPVSWSVKSGGLTAQFKGISKYLEFQTPPSLAYFFPTTFHAAVADSVEPPRAALGWLTVPWRVGSYFTAAGGSSGTDRTNMRSILRTAAADTIAPTVTLVSPLSLDGIATDQAIKLEFDDDHGIEYYVIFAVFPALGLCELVVDGGDLSLATAYTRTPTTVGGKQRWEFVRTGGWPQKQGVAVSGFVRARAIDGGGNLA